MIGRWLLLFSVLVSSCRLLWRRLEVGEREVHHDNWFLIDSAGGHIGMGPI